MRCLLPHVTILALAMLITACPTRPMPCNDDRDCDAPRNACDTTDPLEGAAGRCVFFLLARKDATTASSSAAPPTSGNSSSASAEIPCTPPCPAGQRCANGLCVCDEQSCEGGCCLNNQCSLVGFHSCGPRGDTCLACDDNRADNCGMSGACRCGTSGACTAGQLCQRGVCECYAATCAGCCDGALCRDRSVDHCGVGGSICLPCDGVKADGCSTAGVCRCGNGPPCGAFKACVNGNCVCDEARCPGCCEGRVCTLSTILTCGVGGRAVHRV